MGDIKKLRKDSTDKNLMNLLDKFIKYAEEKTREGSDLFIDKHPYN